AIVSQQLGKLALVLAAGNDNLGGDQLLKLPDPESPRVAIDVLIGEEFEMAFAEDERLPVREGDVPPSVDGTSRGSPRESRLKGPEVLYAFLRKDHCRYSLVSVNSNVQQICATDLVLLCLLTLHSDTDLWPLSTEIGDRPIDHARLHDVSPMQCHSPTDSAPADKLFIVLTTVGASTYELAYFVNYWPPPVKNEIRCMSKSIAARPRAPHGSETLRHTVIYRHPIDSAGASDSVVGGPEWGRAGPAARRFRYLSFAKRRPLTRPRKLS
ncbi:hypothetical protein THAOC_34919, partial [Thalassiosira oceanica]